MSLLTEKFLFLDCQTTGMRPSSGHLLELAWSWGRASDEKVLESQSKLITLPEGESVPFRITQITGISDSELRAEGKSAANVWRGFHEDLSKQEGAPAAIIHYAQFEKPFMEALYRQEGQLPELPFEILCTSKIAKKLLPQLPSRNLRALAGYFGLQVGDLKRAGSHVAGTFEIWRGLAEELEKLGVKSREELKTWLGEAPKVKAVKYEYRIDKETRLNLPDQPGVYRMKAKNGDVLYVGKATSLKSRVNSYFRGKKGRDVRKLEMLTQVWSLEVTPTETPLESALLENEEIKRLNPPYNVSLKTGNRRLHFYSRDFGSAQSRQDEGHVRGPFRPMNSIEQLRLLKESISTGLFRAIFYIDIPLEDLALGFELYCEEQGLVLSAKPTVRSLLAWGHWRLREQIRDERALAVQARQESAKAQTASNSRDESAMSDELENLEQTNVSQAISPSDTPQGLKPDPADLLEEEEEESLGEEPFTVTEISEKYGRLFIRAAAETRRARLLTRLLNSEVRWELAGQTRTLSFRGGRIAPALAPPAPRVCCPWAELNIIDFDRMSILLSELMKHPHEIRARLVEPEAPAGPSASPEISLA